MLLSLPGVQLQVLFTRKESLAVPGEANSAIESRGRKREEFLPLLLLLEGKVKRHSRAAAAMPATWTDVIGLVVVSTLFFGAIAGFIYVTESAKKAAACV